MITSIIIAALVALFAYAKVKTKNIPLVADHKNILTLTDENIHNQTKNRVVLVDFWAEWCAPCKMMAPVLNEVAIELNGTAHVGKVNIELYQSLAQKYKVLNIPTLILLKNGHEVNRFVGIKNKEFLLNKIQNA